MILLERDEPLAVLHDLLRQASNGHGRVAVILGEAGIGKTSLVDAFLSALPKETRVLQSACEDFSIAEPLGPLRDLAREAGWIPNHDPGDSGARLPLFSEALDVLSAETGATVVVVEDVHWADEATLDFLRFLVRRIRDRPIMLMATARNDGAVGRSRLRAALGDAPPDCISRLVLQPLSEAAVAAMAAESGADAAQLHRTTGGNAFYVTELLHGDGHRPPLSVQDAVLRRADRLPPGARAVLDSVAIAPRRCEAELVEALTGTQGYAGDLEICVSHGLLDIQGSFVAFRHELAREAVEHALAEPRRRELHMQLLRLLRSRNDVPKARLLHHARLAGNEDTVRRLAPEAATEAARLGARREAADHYQLAIDHSDHLDPAARADLHEACAWACYLVGQSDVAAQAQETALSEIRKLGDPRREGDALRKLSRFCWNAADLAPAEDAALEAVRVLENLPGPELAMAHSTVAQLRMLDYRFASVREHAERAIALAETCDRPDILAHALNNRGMSLVWVDPEAGRNDMARSLKIATRVNAVDDIGRAYTNSAFFEYYRNAFDDAVRIAQRGIEYSTANELDGFLGYIEGTLAWALLRLGRWDEATAYARQGFRRLSREGGRNRPFTGACALIWTDSRRGTDLEPDALDFLEDFMARMPELQRATFHAAITGERAWLGLADPADALALLETTLARAEDPALVPYVLPWIRKLDPDRSLPDSPHLTPPYRHMVAGDWRSTAAEWAALSAPYDEALALAEGDEPARQRALEILEDLGADRAAETVRAEMRRDGIAGMPPVPRASTRANPAGLTRRQMDVLGGLNEGLSNAEIAERLFIAPKTVDHHISAILAKLDVKTRGEAAAKARRIGLIRQGA